MIKSRAKGIALLGLALSLWLGPMQAQDATRANPEDTGVSPGTSGTDVGEAGRVIVTGVTPAQSILPTIRPISSTYGTDMNIVDTPRDVSTITKEQVSFRQITSVDDLGQFASGTYTASIFGAEGLPQIRGLPAEIYLNGQREHYYLNSFPPSFNGVESIDIVKGPGTAVYGPASQGLGGYVNLVTKQPFFDGQHTEVTSIIGDFYGSPDSYGRYQWELGGGRSGRAENIPANLSSGHPSVKSAKRRPAPRAGCATAARARRCAGATPATTLPRSSTLRR